MTDALTSLEASRLRQRTETHRQQSLGRVHKLFGGQDRDIEQGIANPQPTPETLAKFDGNGDAIERLYKAGSITMEENTAARRIATAHIILTSPVRIRTSSVESKVDRSGRGSGGEESVWSVRLQRHYTEWRRRVQYDRLFSAVMALVVVGDSVNAVSLAYRTDKRTLVRALKWLLKEFGRVERGRAPRNDFVTQGE